MRDRDLADLYKTETKQLNRAVRRNISRFPDDFMFERCPKEFNNLRSQFDTSSWGGTRYVFYLNNCIRKEVDELILWFIPYFDIL